MKNNWIVGERVLDDFIIERILGEGGFGCSYLLISDIKGKPGLQYVVTGVRFAAKKLSLPEDVLNNLRAELQAHYELPSHPNILELKFFKFTQQDLIIFTEFMEDGNLSDKIVELENDMLGILDYAIQIAYGISFMHSCGLIHGDLKPQNVFLSGNNIKVGDFGTSSVLDKQYLRDDFSYTPIYAAPEQKLKAKISIASDLYSFGLLLWEMFSQSIHWDLEKPASASFAEYIANSQNSSIPEPIEQIISNCLQEAPEKRELSLDKIKLILEEFYHLQTGELYPNKDYDENAIDLSSEKNNGIRMQEWFDARRSFMRVSGIIDTHLPENDLVHKYYPGSLTAIAGGNGLSPKSQLVNAVDILMRTVALLNEFIEESNKKEYKAEFIFLFDQLITVFEILGDYSGMMNYMDSRINVLTEICQDDDSNFTKYGYDLIESIRAKACFLDEMGYSIEALETFDQGITRFNQVIDHLDLDNFTKFYVVLFTIHIDQGVTYIKLEQYLEGQNSFEKGIEILETHSVNVDEQKLAWAYTQYANCLDCLGEIDKALGLYDRSINLYIKQNPSILILDELSSSYLNKAICLQKLANKESETLTLMDECVEIRKNIISENFIMNDRASGFQFLSNSEIPELPSGKVNWMNFHRMAFAYYTRSIELDKVKKFDLALTDIQTAHDIWKDLVEGQGHSELGSFQFNAMMLSVQIEMNKEDQLNG